MHTTEAWVIHEGQPGTREPARLRKEAVAVAAPNDGDALIEPIYGSWEANMTHAIERRPIDVCRNRGEPRVVLGNAGVVRVLRPGAAIKHVRAGDLCMFFGTGRRDAFGYMELAHAYDAPGTIGLLAKQTTVPGENLFVLPPGSRHTPAQWAAFSLRYMTAWSNWRVAIGALRLQLSEQDLPEPHVWGWGGGSTLAELSLARRSGCRAVMVTADPERAEIAAAGIDTVDRRGFSALQLDARRFAEDERYARAYRAAEAQFLGAVLERTRGLGVSIFVDYIGTPVARATLKAIGRQGVHTTAGWKCGMETSVVRAIECTRRHTHVYTHYARLSEAPEAMAYAERTGWMPPPPERLHAWDEIPRLADAYAAGTLGTYFPVFAVNPL